MTFGRYLDMNCNPRNMTKYLRSAVTAQNDTAIDFKDDFYILSPNELNAGNISTDITSKIFASYKKRRSDIDDSKNSKDITNINVIICAKTIKTIYSADAKVQDEVEELTGIFYIPAILNTKGFITYDREGHKLPWFPREFMEPMIEPLLAVGNADSVDKFISEHVDMVEKIESWSDYVAFYNKFYETVSESKFDQSLLKYGASESAQELENNVYLFIDNTINSTFHILELYNQLLQDEQPKPLYDNFISTEPANIFPLIKDSIETEQLHAGQMNGEYPLSPSQREAINHFNNMNNGEILAVNGPPGTGKTTLLQTIVADMYVKRALSQDKAPLIVASSTNNQAVTNIITSFGNISKIGIGNLEERWITGINSFATYFPASSKIKEAKAKGFQYTNQKGEFFVSEIEDKENRESSNSKLINNCSEYFSDRFDNLDSCKQALHNELVCLEEHKKSLLLLLQNFINLGLCGEDVEKYLVKVDADIEACQNKISYIRTRTMEWQECYKKIPLIYRVLKFIKPFSRRIQTTFRLFIDESEQEFINEYMNLSDILEEYSKLHAQYTKNIGVFKRRKEPIIEVKDQYDNLVEQLEHHNVKLSHNDEKYIIDVEKTNNKIDKSIRYIEFWLAVHYYECRWAIGEDELSEKQKGTNYKNVLDLFYNRLAMITPCLVMTFFMLPKQFLAYGDQKKFFLYNYIDLLIVDEAGQVSPEIAAGAFSLAKKAVVVGDVNQIEPVWGINRALDKTLAISNSVIQYQTEYETLQQSGLNCSSSSVMVVASKCCKYKKYSQRGLFLSEHRRCYNEIIDYCNRLVYEGNLQPLRGRGKDDDKLAINRWPQMGYFQIDSDYSVKKGTSRCNPAEAEEIVRWMKTNFQFIKESYPDEDAKNLIGIITPFTAQVRCLQETMKRHFSRHDMNLLSIGTVHTFQGAERKIIIFSTVYGNQENCSFINYKKSLMNVAVSRAKDNFFVFGDSNCLTGSKSDASGLLKSIIRTNEIKE